MAAARNTIRGHLKTGRPPKNPGKVKYYETKLHKMLVPKLRHVDGVVRGDRIDTSALAKALNVARFTVYRWFEAPRLSPKVAQKLMKLSKGKLTRDDVVPFILG